MIETAAAQKPVRKNMPSVPCYKCTEIAGIWKTFKWNPGSFGKSCRKFRIQDLKKLDTVFDLFVCHLKFITLPASGNDHQRAGAELLVHSTLDTFASHICPQDIFTWKIINQHSFCEDKISVLDSYFSKFHIFLLPFSDQAEFCESVPDSIVKHICGHIVCQFPDLL